MSKFHEKVEGHTKQIVGQMVGDDELVLEGKEQQRRACEQSSVGRAGSRDDAAETIRKRNKPG